MLATPPVFASWMYTATFLNHDANYIWQIFYKNNDILQFLMSDLFFNDYFLQCTGGLFSSLGAFLPELTFSPLLVLSSFSLGLAWINRWSKKPIMDDTRMIRLDHESPPPPLYTSLPPPPHPRRTIEHFWILNLGPETQRHATQVAGRWGLIKWKRVRYKKNLLYQCDESNEPTKEGPLHILHTVLQESPFASVSTVNSGHPPMVSLFLDSVIRP
jgi:hypothetical protein